MKIYSYSLFVIGLIFLSIGGFYFWSYFHNQNLVASGQQPDYWMPNASGKAGIWVLLFSIVLLKTWWVPAFIGLLGLYMVYQSFKEEAKIERQ